MADKLFEPVKVGDLELKNRIVRAPMTRGRAGETRVANELMATGAVEQASGLPQACRCLCGAASRGDHQQNAGVAGARVGVDPVGRRPGIS